MSCGLFRAIRKKQPDSNTILGARPIPADEGPPPYSEVPLPVQVPNLREEDGKREFTTQKSFRQVLQSLYDKREELLDTIEDEPYTVHQATLQFREAVSNYGKAEWGEEGRREYNRVERRYQMIQTKHRQHQKKLGEIEREIHQMKTRRR